MRDEALRLPDARFSCQSCGRCCTLWSVTLDASKAAALRRHDWSAFGRGDPFERNRGPGEPFRIRLVDGRCFFLDADQRCRIHSRLGYDAKPEGCKAFPLHFTTVAGTHYGRLSFYCPTVSANQGKPLREQQRWARAVLKQAGAGAHQGPFRLNQTIELTGAELDRLERQLVRWVEQPRGTVAQRLAAGAALLAELERRIVEQGKRAVAPCLAEAEQWDVVARYAEWQAGGRAAQAGPVLSLFLGADCASGAWPRLRHFFGVRLFQLGLAPLRSRLLHARASRRQLERVAFDPPLGDEALLQRYFVHKLQGRRHLGGDTPLIGGFNLLVAAYGVISVLARLSAAHHGRPSVDAHDVAAAVQAADLLVVEHATLLHKPLFAALIERVLAGPALARARFARVGPPPSAGPPNAG